MTLAAYDPGDRWYRAHKARGAAVQAEIEFLIKLRLNESPLLKDAVRAFARWLGVLVVEPSAIEADGTRWGTWRSVAEGWLIRWAEIAGLDLLEVLLLLDTGELETKEAGTWRAYRWSRLG